MLDRDISHSAVHAKAVEIGRKSSIPEVAERLATSNPEKYIVHLMGNSKEEVAKAMTDEEIVEALATHLWVGWLQAELNHVEAANRS
jgi:threonine synthase